MRIVIVGAGIGGLAAALSFHAAGFRNVLVLEAARAIREMGVGLNLPPHAVRELNELDLADAVREAGFLIEALAYYDEKGQSIWTEPRGLQAGYRWPQYAMHRGRLQGLLLDAVRARLGPSSIETGQRIVSARTEGNHAVIEGVDQGSGAATRYVADLVVVADGIRSAVRDSLLGNATPIATNDWVMYRGVADGVPFLDGHSMVIVGDEKQRVVVYPIGKGRLNWLLSRPRVTDVHATQLGNWNVGITPSTVAAFATAYRFAWLDIEALIARSSRAYEYPMADIDPLPQWAFGRCILLGDAAHAMYPFGSNGASQAILDARVLAYEVATENNLERALERFDAQRRPTVAQVQLANRRQASEVMARVSAMARRGAHGNAATELQAVESGYKQLAGFDVDALNNRKSWSIAGRDHNGPAQS